MHGISYTFTNSWQINSAFRIYLDFKKGNLNGTNFLWFFCLFHLQQGDCVISKVLTFDLSQYPDANPNPNE